MLLRCATVLAKTGKYRNHMNKIGPNIGRTLIPLFKQRKKGNLANIYIYIIKLCTYVSSSFSNVLSSNLQFGKEFGACANVHTLFYVEEMQSRIIEVNAN